MIAATVPATLTTVLSFLLLSLFLRHQLVAGLGPVFAAAIPAQIFC